MSVFSSSSSATRQPFRTTSNIAGLIDLTDNTRPASEPQELDRDQEELIGTILKKTGSRIPNPTKLREEIARRKYAKYQEEKYNSEDDNYGSDPHSSTSNLVASDALKPSGDDTDLNSLKKTNTAGRIRRGQQRVKGFLGYGKKSKAVHDKDAEIDVMYENQRGSWFFGYPLFSSNSLLNFDPSRWTNAQNKPSPVNITNAQLPDPSWEWVWKTWYVDMNLDVDEQGWEYSFMFQNRFPWHGTHPWFHSFVRRRRWIRKRVRRHKETVVGQLDCVHEKHHTASHKLNADYFSVHPAGDERRENESVYGLVLSGNPSTERTLVGDAPKGDDDDIDNIQTLLKRLKRATVDREKIKLVLQYMDQGGEDTHYLADEIAHIMSYLMFQDSRRQLVAQMLIKLDERQDSPSSVQRSSHDAKDKGKQKSIQGKDASNPESEQSNPEDEERAKRKSSNLLRAVEAADQQIKNLEYWSDIKDATRNGETLGKGEDLGAAAGGPAAL